MKNLFLGLIFLAGTAISFANSKNMLKVNTTTNKVLTICYRPAVDDFGNKYMARVTCPPKLIIIK